MGDIGTLVVYGVFRWQLARPQQGKKLLRFGLIESVGRIVSSNTPPFLGG